VQADKDKENTKGNSGQLKCMCSSNALYLPSSYHRFHCYVSCFLMDGCEKEYDRLLIRREGVE
jgi:hypothetical protein